MINIFNKAEIINLKEKGYSNRQVAKITGIDRKTVASYWNKHLNLIDEVEKCETKNDIREVQEKIHSIPTYDSSNRKRRKVSDEMMNVIEELLLEEIKKDLLFKYNHKQKITNDLIHRELINKGFEISLSTVASIVRERKNIIKETFIRQHYVFGQRIEFDFGEVKLYINDEYIKAYLAVISSPASDYRVAYLYLSQCKKVFFDAHIRFFEETGGIYNEVVYDNMRNVVSKFIGKNEKQLNEDLVKLSLYYGFEINVTNCFSGNEKGHVEGSVKHIRTQAFSLKYQFETLDQARIHLKNCIDELNRKSKINEELKYLKPIKPQLEIADITKNKVSKYSVIRVENNFYSVPEDLNGKEVLVKNYLDDIEIYYKENFICGHKKINGLNEYVLDIKHYLKTFSNKPGALRNSQALANNPELKTIYIKYFIKKPKLFIELIEENKHLNSEELNQILVNNSNIKNKSIELESTITNASENQIKLYTQLLKGENNYGIN